MTAAAKLCVMSADLDALVALMPFARHLGLVLDEASPDRVIARLDWAPHLCTSGGIMHGGVLMSLADSAGALVTFLGLLEGSTTATITFTSQFPAGQQRVRPRGCGPRAPRPHHGDGPDQPVRLRTAPGRPDHADPGRPAAPGLRLEHRPGTKAIWRIFSPRALPEKGGSPPLIGVDSGSVVDCVHHRPPDQPPSPNQPRKWGGSCVRGR